MNPISQARQLSLAVSVAASLLMCCGNAFAACKAASIEGMKIPQEQKSSAQLKFDCGYKNASLSRAEAQKTCFPQVEREASPGFFLDCVSDGWRAAK